MTHTNTPTNIIANEIIDGFPFEHGDAEIQLARDYLKLVEDESSMQTQLIEERDMWQENSTQLADQIAGLFEIDFGEFSNCNDPVENASAHITDMNNAKAV